MGQHLASQLFKGTLVIVLAAASGWLGLALMFAGSYVPQVDDFWTIYVMGASVLIWSVASVMLQRKTIQDWLMFGLLSPLLGALLVAPPGSLAFIMIKGYIAFPVGLTTGFIMYAAERLTRRL